MYVNYADALLFLDNTYQFVSTGNEYESIEWYDEREKPSKEVLEHKYQELLHNNDLNSYKKQRKSEYPSWEVLADAIYHQQKGDVSKMQEYIRLCDEVKQKYPKSK
jgi:hypothetical protein